MIDVTIKYNDGEFDTWVPSIPVRPCKISFYYDGHIQSREFSHSEYIFDIHGNPSSVVIHCKNY